VNRLIVFKVIEKLEFRQNFRTSGGVGYSSELLKNSMYIISLVFDGAWKRNFIILRDRRYIISKRGNRL
jgi:hypothetical protein